MERDSNRRGTEEPEVMSPPVKIFAVRADEVTVSARNRLADLGLNVVVKRCPPSVADWVEFPFLRAPSGESYYGPDEVATFVAEAEASEGDAGA
jgi:hypothetical protein